MNVNKKLILLIAVFGFLAAGLKAQESQLPINPSLKQLIDFALQNKISVQTAYLDERIGEEEIASSLSGWLPQVHANAGYNYQMQVPSNVIGDQVIKMGQKHSSSLAFQAEQALLRPDLMFAKKTADLYRQNFQQVIEDEKINTVVQVSKAYFDILTAEEQIKIIKENIARLSRQLNDAKARYNTGLVDKTDFKRAQISLNNAEADLKKLSEQKTYKYNYLKYLINSDPTVEIDLSPNKVEDLESQIHIDTTEYLQTKSRIEYKQLLTQKELQKANTQYARWNFLPRLSAFANYQMDFRNNTFSKVYSNSYPSSVLGLSLSIPIFQGGKRTHDIRKSQLQEERIDWEIQNLENNIQTEYSAALTNYKTSVVDWKNAKLNVDLSEEVYNTIKLQYDEGIKTYLDLMTAETDLRTSQINYLNALYTILSSKIDVQKSLGNITFD